jgi:AcrR family transcriptional regulator
MVPSAVETNRERVSRRQVDKFAERRAQLADAALQTLAELGYARTSLREIAQNTEFSHGVLHYYFSDKEDLITHCVRQYEAACVTRYDEIVASASSAGELKREFSAAMAQTLRTDAPMHRLWYDLRNQSLFEESFRADVLEIDQRREEMIWRVISRYASFGGFSVALSPGRRTRSWTGCSSRPCCITWPGARPRPRSARERGRGCWTPWRLRGAALTAARS